MRRYLTVKEEIHSESVNLTVPKKWFSSEFSFNPGSSTLGWCRRPWYKNVLQSFMESNMIAWLWELYLGLLFHSSAGLSWINIAPIFGAAKDSALPVYNLQD